MLNTLTKEQLVTINRLKEEQKVKEVILYKTGIVGVIAEAIFKRVVPQGNINMAFDIKAKFKTYYVLKDGAVHSIAIGKRRGY